MPAPLLTVTSLLSASTSCKISQGNDFLNRSPSLAYCISYPHGPLRDVFKLWYMYRGAHRDSRLAVPNGAGRVISGHVKSTGQILAPNMALNFGAGQKNYQCHGTGGTGQMGALVYVLLTCTHSENILHSTYILNSQAIQGFLTIHNPSR